MKPGFCGICLVLAVAFGRSADAAERTRPPKWSRDVLDAFFEDAREKLDGPRPDYSQAVASQVGPIEREATSEASRTAWSNLIDAATLENEIKRLSKSLDAAVSTPSEFKASGYKTAHRDFSELAVLFAVIGQYDGEVRWQPVAAGMRGQFARAGFNATVGTDATYREAVARKQELAALVRGERPSTPKTSNVFDDWSQVAARPQLMQRINTAHEERLKPWVADAATFRRNRDGVRHEAQIVALLADVIHRQAFEFWDDETFVEYAGELRDAAVDAANAAEADNFDQARAAVTRATGACTSCHAGYRG